MLQLENPEEKPCDSSSKINNNHFTDTNLSAVTPQGHTGLVAHITHCVYLQDDMCICEIKSTD